MTKKICLFLLVFSTLFTSVIPFVSAADNELIFYVAQGAAGTGTKDSPFGSIEEAFSTLGSQDGKIVIDGKYDISDLQIPAFKGEITIAGANNSVITAKSNTNINIPGKLVFKDINFDLGENSSFICSGKTITFDIGNNTFDSTVYLSSSNFSNYAICSDIIVKSGNINKVVLGNSETELQKYSASGTVDIEVKGGVIQELVLSPEKTSENKYIISGNVNITCTMGGMIENITCNKDAAYTIKGVLSMVFNEGVGVPEKLEYPDSSEGVYILTTTKGGSLLPTSDAGVYDVKTTSDKILAINGKSMNVKETLQIDAGVYNLEWITKTNKDSDENFVPTITDIPVVLYYDPNGGLNPPAAKEVLIGSTIIINSKIPANSGYRFLGWSLDKNAKTASYQPGDEFVCNDNISLYAVWEEVDEYILTYSATGAFYVPENETFPVGEEVKLSKIIPSKKGYIFLGWALKNDAETADYAAGETIKLKNDTTLYGVWKKGVEIVLAINSKIATISGVSIENDVAPIIENDRTMLPARFVAENLDAEVEWDDKNRTVIITTQDTEILIPINSDTAKVNGKEVKLDSPAFIRNDRTYTPVRFICESLGAEVSWNDAERKVTITK